jgi:hypothetical protein
VASEIVIPENLNGAEVRTAIAKAVNDALRGRGGIRDIDSYSTFRAEIHIKVTLHDVGGPKEVEVPVTSNFGQVPEGEDEDQYLEQFEANLEMDTAAPNEVRQDAELPIPVLTSENGKPAVKRVKYSRDNKAGKK